MGRDVRFRCIVDQSEFECGFALSTTYPAYPIRAFPSSGELAAALATELHALLAASRGAPVALMLAGGRTPLAAYAGLARLPALPPSHGARILLSDERVVPPDDPRCNARSVWPPLSAIGLRPAQAVLVDGRLDPAAAAAQFDGQLAALLAAGAGLPLGLLGLGADGHTAGLFSAAQVRAGRGRWAQAVERPDGMAGVSVTADFLARIAQVRFVVTGAEKRDVLQRLRAAPLELAAGHAVAGCRAVEIWADRAAVGAG